MENHENDHRAMTTHESPPDEIIGEPFDFWPEKNPAVIAKNGFKYKSLSNWTFNISVGCSHACRFCYVPSAATNRQIRTLEKFGVKSAGNEWGDYSLLRHWNEEAFLVSLRAAEKTPKSKLKPDGNRAVMFCSTTDPYQTFKGSTPEKTALLQSSARALVRKALETIRDKSTLNVRILTRSPLAQKDFDLFKSFGNRLVFGMSLPTLNNKLSKIYEPKAPAPSQRLETLRAAKKAGLHVYVAVAPSFPESNEADLRATLTAIKEIDPITIFHEPINIRAENIRRIEQHAEQLGVKVKTAVFKKQGWRRYALESLIMMQSLATELGMLDHLHLWPDERLLIKAKFLEIRRQQRADLGINRHQQDMAQPEDEDYYNEQYKPWIEKWWSRISEWPGK